MSLRTYRHPRIHIKRRNRHVPPLLLASGGIFRLVRVRLNIHTDHTLLLCTNRQPPFRLKIRTWATDVVNCTACNFIRPILILGNDHHRITRHHHHPFVFVQRRFRKSPKKFEFGGVCGRLRLRRTSTNFYKVPHIRICGTRGDRQTVVHFKKPANLKQDGSFFAIFTFLF